MKQQLIPRNLFWTLALQGITIIQSLFNTLQVHGILYIEPEPFRVISFANTDYENCTETRRSVGCTIITIGGCLTDWSMAKHLTLLWWDSSCEAEYKELAKCAKGVKFTQMLLGKLRLRELPGILFEDNLGSIFLAQNKQVSKRTKHIDLKHHFIREFTECQDGIQQEKIFKIESEFNTADIRTKNVEARLFNRHEEKSIQECLRWEKVSTVTMGLSHRRFLVVCHTVRTCEIFRGCFMTQCLYLPLLWNYNIDNAEYEGWGIAADVMKWRCDHGK
jgi:hypothetical protein